MNQPSNTGFWTHHGAWAPGVRLFRKLSFKSKAAFIAGSFLLPLAVIGAKTLHDSRSSIQALQLEAAGARYSLLTAPAEFAMASLQAASKATEEERYNQARAAIIAALQSIQAQVTSKGDPLAIKQLADRAAQAASSLPAKPEASMTKEAAKALHTLSVAIINNSGLALDTDLSDLYSVFAFGDDLPKIISAVADVQGAGAASIDAIANGDATADALAVQAFAGAAKASGRLSAFEERIGMIRSANAARVAGTNLAWQEPIHQYLKEAEQAFFSAAQQAHQSPLKWYARGEDLRSAMLASQQAGLTSLMNSIDSRLATERESAVALAAIVAAFIFLGVYLFHSFYLVMTGGLSEVKRHLGAMADGDLTQSPSPWGSDEVAHLMNALREMQASLRDVVGAVRTSAHNLAQTSESISLGSVDLASRTESMAASLEQSAAAMDEIGSTVQQTATAALEAAQLAHRNADTAQASGTVLSEVQATMSRIDQSSEQIGSIIGTIDGIAFQTNILALNAAVEAARAGEAGRGFAVVAAEVRALAQRSAEAAREIKTLVTQSIETIRNGSAVANRASVTVAQAVEASGHINALMGGIATGAQEQSAGVTQITAALQDLDRTTQQNAALVQLSTTNAAQLSAHSSKLSQEVARFVLPGDSRSSSLVDLEDIDCDFQAAITAHREWKSRLRQAIQDHAQLDAAAIQRDDQCPLGRCLHGAGKQKWGNSPRFRDLVAKHAQFHVAASRVAGAINAGEMHQAERMIAPGSEFSAASAKVCALLEQCDQHGF